MRGKLLDLGRVTVKNNILSRIVNGISSMIQNILGVVR